MPTARRLEAFGANAVLPKFANCKWFSFREYLASKLPAHRQTDRQTDRSSDNKGRLELAAAANSYASDSVLKFLVA